MCCHWSIVSTSSVQGLAAVTDKDTVRTIPLIYSGRLSPRILTVVNPVIQVKSRNSAVSSVKLRVRDSGGYYFELFMFLAFI